MEEELMLIRHRLEHLEGVQLAQQLVLTAFGQELRSKDWFALMGIDARVEEAMQTLRYSSASDLTIQSFQQTISELMKKLD